MKSLDESRGCHSICIYPSEVGNSSCFRVKVLSLKQCTVGFHIDVGDEVLVLFAVLYTARIITQFNLHRMCANIKVKTNNSKHETLYFNTTKIFHSLMANT